MSFKKHDIRVDFTLASGAFGNTSFDSVSLSGLALSAQIQVAPMGFSRANISVFGLHKDIIERLVTLKADPKGQAYQRNKIKLTLNEYDDKDTVLFQGDIILAMPDFNRAPDVPVVIEASPLYATQLTVPAGINFPKSSKVSDVIKKLAKESGFLFKNNGVPDSVVVSDLSLNGNLKVMMEQVAAMADVDYAIDEQAETVIISPRGKPLEGLEEITISRDTGMIRYPIPVDYGCLVSHIFSPRFRIFHPANIVCPDVPIANGKMTIATIMNKLDTNIPAGQWISDIKLKRYTG